MGSELLMAIGVFGVIGGASAFAIARAKAAHRKSWVEEMEAERQARRLADLD